MLLGPTAVYYDIVYLCAHKRLLLTDVVKQSEGARYISNTVMPAIYRYVIPAARTVQLALSSPGNTILQVEP